LFFITPAFNLMARALSLEIGAAILVLGAVFLTLGPALGAVARFAYVAAFSAALGMAGALGLAALDDPSSPSINALPALGFALGAGVGVGAVSDFAKLFARGADGKRAAGVAARYGAAPAIYAIFLASAIGGLAVLQTGNATETLRVAWIAGGAALLSAAASLFMTTGALATRRSGEILAIEENRREQSFRRFWRPARRAIAPSSATAFLAIVGVATVAASFNLQKPISPDHLAFVVAASLVAAVLFLSLRTGAFVLLILLPGLVITSWAWNAVGAYPLAEASVGAALALAAALYAQLAVAWRDARSPRLNARETAEAAMSDGTPPFLVSAIIGAAAFWAAKIAGVWPEGGPAALLLALLALLGIIAAPAVMTALSYSARREFT
jgi:hypothetical protein